MCTQRKLMYHLLSRSKSTPLSPNLMPKLNKVSYFKMKKKTPNVIFQPTGKRKKKPGP